MPLTLIPFCVPLDTGERVRIREITPADRDLLLAGFAQLSERSRYLRFLSAHPSLSEAELDTFTATGDHSHAAIGAERQGAGAVEPLGSARYVRLNPESEAAEIALTIVDHAQGIGLGRALLGALMRHAVENGIREFVALVHPENTAMRALLRRLGACENGSDFGQVEIRVPLGPPVDDDGNALVGTLADAYQRAELG
nr:GNAT family N-acetyltransferase [uncultured Roseovarius sp.]